MPTQLLYLENMHRTHCNATVSQIYEENGKTVVILDQTIFYPQGGGQPSDQGIIQNKQARFIVKEVRYSEGIVKHIGFFETGTFKPGDSVGCTIDNERRALLSKIHSAGHIIDVAVTDLGYNWIPGKGFHFPEGPYVEYTSTSFDGTDKEKLKTDIEAAIKKVIEQKLTTRIEFVDKNQLSKRCTHVPENLPTDKPIRVVIFGNYVCPCGGTHVENLADIGNVTVRKIKIDGNTIRISYQCS